MSNLSVLQYVIKKINQNNGIVGDDCKNVIKQLLMYGKLSTKEISIAKYIIQKSNEQNTRGNADTIIDKYLFNFVDIVENYNELNIEMTSSIIYDSEPYYIYLPDNTGTPNQTLTINNISDNNNVYVIANSVNTLYYMTAVIGNSATFDYVGNKWIGTADFQEPILATELSLSNQTETLIFDSDTNDYVKLAPNIDCNINFTADGVIGGQYLLINMTDHKITLDNVINFNEENVSLDNHGNINLIVHEHEFDKWYNGTVKLIYDMPTTYYNFNIIDNSNWNSMLFNNITIPEKICFINNNSNSAYVYFDDGNKCVKIDTDDKILFNYIDRNWVCLADESKITDQSVYVYDNHDLAIPVNNYDVIEIPISIQSIELDPSEISDKTLFIYNSDSYNSVIINDIKITIMGVKFKFDGTYWYYGTKGEFTDLPTVYNSFNIINNDSWYTILRSNDNINMIPNYISFVNTNNYDARIYYNNGSNYTIIPRNVRTTFEYKNDDKWYCLGDPSKIYSQSYMTYNNATFDIDVNYDVIEITIRDIDKTLPDPLFGKTIFIYSSTENSNNKVNGYDITTFGVAFEFTTSWNKISFINV